MRFKLLIISLFLTSGFLYAQTEPYYQLPKERTEKGAKTFPNLKASAIKFYVRPEGGLFVQGNSLDNNLDGQLISGKQVLTTWGAALGYNFKDRWMAEIGYLQSPLLLISSLKLTPFLVTLSPEKMLHLLPVRIQKRVWTIDRVSRSTSLFLGGGIGLPTNGKAGDVFNRREAYLQPTFARNPPDTVRISNVVSLLKTPVQAQFSAEIRGKIVEELEVGVCMNYQTSFGRIYRSEINLQRNREAPLLAIQTLNARALRFGISIHYNFGIITNYETDIK